MVSESSVSDYALFGSQGVVLLLGQSSDCWLLDHRVSYRCWVSRQIAGCWTTGCRTTAGSVVILLVVGPHDVVPLLGRQIAGCSTTGCRTAAGSVVRLLAVGPQGVVPLLGRQISDRALDCLHCQTTVCGWCQTPEQQTTGSPGSSAVMM